MDAAKAANEKKAKKEEGAKDAKAAKKKPVMARHQVTDKFESWHKSVGESDMPAANVETDSMAGNVSEAGTSEVSSLALETASDCPSIPHFEEEQNEPIPYFEESTPHYRGNSVVCGIGINSDFLYILTPSISSPSPLTAAEPGRMAVTRMMPRITANTVVAM